MGRGVPLPTRGGVFFDFGAKNGEFWCILVVICYSSAACFTSKEAPYVGHCNNINQYSQAKKMMQIFLNNEPRWSVHATGRLCSTINSVNSTSAWMMLKSFPLLSTKNCSILRVKRSESPTFAVCLMFGHAVRCR